MRTGLLVVLAACGSVANNPDAHVGNDTGAPDVSTVDGMPGPCNLAAPFGAPVNVSALNSNAEDAWGWLSADQLTVYLTSVATGSADRNAYVATRASTTATFGTPILLPGVNTMAAESRPVVTADGLTLFEQSDAGGTGTLHIYVASRSSTAAQFSALAPAAGVNSNALDGQPWISDDGLTMLLASTRGGNNNYDIYKATRPSTTSSFGTPAPIAELDGPTSVEDAPVLSKDGLEVFFASNRVNNRNDIWHATRSTTSDGFGTPTMLAELSTGTSDDFPSWVSPDRCTLWFSSDRAGGNGSYDIWMATRPK